MFATAFNLKPGADAYSSVFPWPNITKEKLHDWGGAGSRGVNTRTPTPVNARVEALQRPR